METISHLTSSRSRSYESFFHDNGVEPSSEFEEDQMEEEVSWVIQEDDETTNNTPQNGWFKNIEEPIWLNSRSNNKKKNQVFLEGYVENSDEDELGRTKSLTDDDLEELKGCLDLGFGFSYEEIPELCNTLPALELCYSMSQKYIDEHQKCPDSMSDTASSGSGHVANWKISSPGDDPEDVKARLKYWAQAVACTVKLCN
ncbi:uncharacterized protein LOC107770061 [Nicotiana tabacum]|uniref:Uncharacterized protein LOC107770061 n=1 Tax=Nicotiana tabacum TaxID=4097 RepID=A0A1S3XYM2_TOBAC|nr:PREDICTED: uncharacterized protein LOC107770061 [Nicotiana tabacum]